MSLISEHDTVISTEQENSAKMPLAEDKAKDVDTKEARAGAKRALTRKGNEVMGLIADYSDDTHTVQTKKSELDSLFERFKHKHGRHHDTLTEEKDRADSLQYLANEEENYNRTVRRFDEYLKRKLAPKSPKSNRSSVSSKSKRKLTLLKASEEELLQRQEVEYELMQLRQKRAAQEILERELKLQHRQDILQIQAEIRKCEIAAEQGDSESDESVEIRLDQEPSPKFTTQNVAAWAHTVNSMRPAPVMDDTSPYNKPAQLNPEAEVWHPNDKASFEDHSPSMIELMQQGQITQKKLIDTLQLPKAELMTFDGDALRYWVFIRAFDNMVAKESIDESSKLIRLHQYCVGKARRVIESCMVMDPSVGYERARQLLQERFGQGYVISEAWIGKITGGSYLKPNDRKALRDFSDDLESCKETLQATGHLAEINVQSTLVKIVGRLPTYLQNRWKKRVLTIRRDGERNPNIEDVARFVREAAEEANDPVYGDLSDHQKDDKRQGVKQRFKGSNYSVSSQDNSEQTLDSRFQRSEVRQVCLKCGANHSLFGCAEFKIMKPKDRIDFARDKRLCFNCLRSDHLASRCGLRRRCSVPECGQKHTKFLHPLENSARTPGATGGQDNKETKATEGKNFSATGAGNYQRIALPIVPVSVRAVGGQTCVETYALLDSGSTHSFCSETLVEKLQISGRPDSLSLTTLDKENSETKTTVVQLEISDMDCSNTVELASVFTRPNLPIKLDNMAKVDDIDRWGHLCDIELPTIDHQHVMLLIGQDNPDILIPIEVRRGMPGEPYATKTIFGWTLNGPIGKSRQHFVTSSYARADQQLEQQLEKFWKIESCESLVDDKLCMSFDDRKALKVWENSLVQHEDKHYELDIPFKARPPMLSPNRQMAEQRLRSLERKLQKDTGLKTAYVTYMNELIAKGYVEKVDTPEDTDTDTVWYLPHHSVVHPKKPEKVRVVFDCAAKWGETSLNKQVLQGPDMTRSLIGVLLRFREEPVAIMADIEAMFHQVRVTPKDRDKLRFLWWPDGKFEQPPEEYRMTVHLFGGTWSPSCCNFVLQHTAKANQTGCDQEAVETVLKNFYVDDCLKSLSDVDKAVSLVKQLCALLLSGGFRLTKWISNKREVLASVPEEDREKEMKGIDLNHDALPVKRALGVYWDTENDDFCYKITPGDKNFTRRGILSVVSSVYDPLGFAGPYVLSAKLIVQNLSRLKLGWDEPVPENELSKWLTWRNELPRLGSFRLKRCVKPTTKVTECQLHMFSDASDVAYGAVAYLRMTDESGSISCCLLIAKSRLAPLKKVTIPRLELMAATLSVKLSHMILKELEIPVTQSVFWTDSTTVLGYIKSDHRRFQTFVANRVALIRDGSEPSEWRFIDSGNNPADDASRTSTADELLNNERWLNGPNFLHQEESNWPEVQQTEFEVSCNDPEVKKEVFFTTDATDLIDQLIQRRSSWYLLKRDVAWLLRLKDWLRCKCKGKETTAKTSALTVDELEQAGLEIVKYTQRQSFADEIRAVSRTETKPVKKALRHVNYATRHPPQGGLIISYLFHFCMKTYVVVLILIISTRRFY